jgi:hypothetical protein
MPRTGKVGIRLVMILHRYGMDVGLKGWNVVRRVQAVLERTE